MLDLSYCHLSSQQMSECSKEMYNEDPEVYSCPFVSVNDIIPIIENLKSIQAISLSGNILRDKEVKKIISTFTDINLQYIDVSDNALSIESVVLFIPFLQNDTFRFLDITGNEKIANKNIINFYRELCRHVHFDEARYLMKKIIFIKKSHMNLNTNFDDWDNWDKFHKVYYDETLVQKMKSKYNIYCNTGINQRNYEILSNKLICCASELFD